MTLKGALRSVSSELVALHVMGRDTSLRSTPVIVSVLVVAAWSRPITEQRISHMTRTAANRRTGSPAHTDRSAYDSLFSFFF